MKGPFALFGTVAVATLTCGCAMVPAHFDVPYAPSGTPLVDSIVQRIRCELVDLVRDDIKPQFNRAPILMLLDYRVAMLLSIDSNDTAGLAPSLGFPGSVLAVNITPSIKLSRQDTINLNLTYSMRDIYFQWQRNPDYYRCPDPDTNLAGNLGIRAKVAAALEVVDLTYNTNVSATGGIFSGVINFTATKSIDKAGPTWTLTNFVGPGPLFAASEVNTDKLSFGFAAGPNAFKPYTKPLPSGPFPGTASQALSFAITNDLSTQLNGIRNALR